MRVAIYLQASGSVLKEIIYHIDEVCVMGVNPDFGGQSLINDSYTKIELLKEIINIRNQRHSSKLTEALI